MELGQKSSGKMLRVALGLTIAVAVVVAGLFIAFYIQAADYHDAKYRAQYVLVSGMAERTYEAAANLEWAASHSERYGSAVAAMEQIAAVGSSAEALSVMYLGDQDRNVTFANLSSAMRALSETVGAGIDSEWAAPNWNSSLVTFHDLLMSVHDELVKGIDQSKDALKHPYSLVNRMDLAKIRGLTDEIMSAIVSIY